MKNQKGHSTIGVLASIVMWIITIGITVLALFGLVYFADKRMQSVEKSECQSWQPDYVEGQGRTPPDWMIMQCARYGIKIGY